MPAVSVFAVVKVVAVAVLLRSLTGWLEPFQLSAVSFASPLQDVALAVVQLISEEPPSVIEAGLAEIWSNGGADAASSATVTGTLLLAVPPGPVQVRVKV